MNQISVDYQHSSNLAEVLSRLKLSVLMSTYQAGKLVVLGSFQNLPVFSFHSFDQVMGIALGSQNLAIGSRRQINFLSPAHDIAKQLAPIGTFDSCYLARASHITGSIHGHDLAYGTEGLWAVNTLFSCLCTIDENYNFFPRWRPPFISQLIDQDRCHLNGLAMQSGLPRFVTVLGITDEPAGWRKNKSSGGAILDVPSGEVIASGLCMPHSPRWYREKLWVLNSGCGQLCTVDLASGKLEQVASLPGYTRGLALYGNYAFVGLSKIRETNVFGGLPIGEHPENLQCGLGIVDISSGQTIATLSFRTGVEELFAVEVLPGYINPKIVGPSLLQGEEKEVWVVPSIEKQSLKSSVDRSKEIGEVSVPSESIETIVKRADEAHQKGLFSEALELLLRAVSLNPCSAENLNRLGNLYQDLNDQTSAISCYQKAVDADPRFAPAQRNLGLLWVVNNEPTRALKHFGLAHESSPNPMNLVLGAKVLPIIYEDQKQLDYWRNRYTQCVQSLVDERVRIDTTNTLVDTSFYLAYQGGDDRDILNNLGKVYHCQDMIYEKPRRKIHGRKIRVGFLSAYFRDHTIGRLNLGRIEQLSRDRYEVSVIALSGSNDALAQAFIGAADHHLSLSRQVSVARRKIIELGLDILVFADIGMDSLTQSLCYSRMAPIQAVTWGHPDTSGSPMIDYFVSSELAETEESQAYYTEKLEKLSNLGVYYHRPKLSGSKPSRESYGLSQSKNIYLCPQTAFKFHPAFDEALRGILQEDKQAELVVLEGRFAAWTNALKRRWERVFPDALQRVRFLPAMSQPDFLHLLSTADVVLDSYPFCGGNTSYEALSLCAPVITCPSPYLRGRLTQAMYLRMGWTDLIASNLQEYVNKAILMGTDKYANQKARATLGKLSGILFENPEDVAVWDEILEKWFNQEPTAIG